MAPHTRRGILVAFLLGAVVIGCGEDIEPGEERLLSVRISDRNRTFILYVPSRYDADRPAALLIAFHGTPGNGPGMRISTGLDEIADREGWLIAYPNGVGGSWGAGCLCSDADLDGIDDVDFVDRLIRRVHDEYSVDDSRLYSVGFSAGGIMSYRVACDLSDTFAAVASVASSMTWAQRETCETADPIPVLAMIGTDDQAFPWLGSGLTAGHSIPIDSTFSFWGHENQCASTPSVDYEAPKEGAMDVRRERFPGCEDGVEVTQYVVEGGDHVWPSTANETIRSFFTRFGTGG